ncbi:DsbA family protein [Primorskyibacter sp. S187A]|uniref:DsbA family protein n=1 Tax=Primorskyibacter sp. S187A TaxID=3415130 RepID=UPI003C7AC7B4
MTPKSRRTILTLAGLGLGYAGLRAAVLNWPQSLVYEPLAAPAGFRRLQGGSSSGAFDPLVGLSAPDAPSTRAAKDRMRADVLRAPCAALYGTLTLTPDQVPIASFSDYFCPFCRVQTEQIADLVARSPDTLAVAWHEMPILSDMSNGAAKLALAAKRQDAYVAAHARLMRIRFRDSPQFLEDFSRDLGLDHNRLLRDIQSPGLARELAVSAAVASALRFVGTPALVVGHTIVQGQITEKTLRRIIEDVRASDWHNACMGG